MYNELKDLYYKNSMLFIMAVSNLLDIGFRNAREITDDDITEAKGNAMMTDDFVRDLLRVTREIARICGNDVCAVIQFCMVEKIFDTKWFKKGR